MRAQPYHLDAAPVLQGVLSVNDKLRKARKILEGEIVGPESMVITDESTIYASLYTSEVVKIVNEKIVSRIVYSEKAKGLKCGTFQNEPVCGRPLGIRQLQKEKFAVVDAYLGVFILDFGDGTSTQVLDSRTPISGRPPMFLNDLDVISDNELIITDSSTNHDRRHSMAILLEHQPDGRVLHLNIATKTAKVLVENCYFPNGIQLLEDEKSFIFSESSMARIMKFTFDTEKLEVFAENLPGFPDNIRSTPRATYWIGLASTRYSAKPSILDRLGSHPRIRQLLVDLVPDSFWENLKNLLRNPHSMVLELDGNGEIVRSLHDVTGKAVGDVSQVTEFNGLLFFGSVDGDFIGVL